MTDSPDLLSGLEGAQTWCAEIRVDAETEARAVTDALENAFHPEALSVSMMREFSDPWPNHSWIIRAYYSFAPEAEDVAAAVDGLSFEAHIAPVPDVDWVTESQKGFPPVEAGRFVVADADHWGEDSVQSRNRTFRIRINAGPGFGTGHHGSTRGCLIALDDLARTYRPSSVLDLGCGSGILAIAARRLWACPVLGTDIHRESIAFAAQSLRENGVPPHGNLLCAAGFHHPRIRRRAPFDLVCANILARPLVQLAPDIARHMTPGGRLIVSGLYASQEGYVTTGFRFLGFRRQGRLAVDDWVTLTFQAP